MQKYKNIDSGEIIFIAEDSGSLLTLSDGVKIMKSFFDKKYSPLLIQNEIDPTTFLNTPGTANYQKIIENQENILKMKASVNPAVSDYVDPNAFFNSGSFDMSTINNAMQAVQNPNAGTIPPSQIEPEVRVLSSTELDDIPGMDSYKKAEYLKSHAVAAPRLSNEQAAQFKQIDEDDPTLLDQFIKKEELRTGQSVNKEIAKRQHEEFLRMQAEETGVEIEDPALNLYEQKIQSSQTENTLQVMEQQTHTKPTTMTQQEDDDYRFFKRFKRNFPITINLSIDDKITKPSTILDIMEDYEGDFIAHYAKDILQKLLSDVAGLEKKIYDQISDIINENVFGKPVQENDPATEMYDEFTKKVIAKVLDKTDISRTEQKLEMIRDVSAQPLITDNVNPESKLEMIRDVSVQPLTMLNEVIEYEDVDPEITREDEFGVVPHDYDLVEPVSSEQINDWSYGMNPKTGEQVYDWLEWQKITEESQQ